MYSHYFKVDLDSHRAKSKGPSKFDESYDETRFLNQELLFKRDAQREKLKGMEAQVGAARAKLARVKETQAAVSAGLPSSSPLLLQTELELARRRRSEQVGIQNYISKAEQFIEYMQRETLNTMRLYL